MVFTFSPFSVVTIFFVLATVASRVYAVNTCRIFFTAFNYKINKIQVNYNGGLWRRLSPLKFRKKETILIKVIKMNMFINVSLQWWRAIGVLWNKENKNF